MLGQVPFHEVDTLCTNLHTLLDYIYTQIFMYEMFIAIDYNNIWNILKEHVCQKQPCMLP